MTLANVLHTGEFQSGYELGLVRSILETTTLNS